MSNPIIYHTPGSCSRVVLVALERIGAPFEARAVSLMTGAQYQPAFQAINPKGKVPVLVDGDLVVTEIPVILYHLASRHPEAALLPIGAAMGSDLSAYPHLLAHRRAAEALPAFTATRALEIDIAEREGLTGPPGIVL
jgi:glutathione S-transferase